LGGAVVTRTGTVVDPGRRVHPNSNSDRRIRSDSGERIGLCEDCRRVLACERTAKGEYKEKSCESKC
ncbi:MAG: hypothetical protein ACREA0_09160, partial [bacterium]